MWKRWALPGWQGSRYPRCPAMSSDISDNSSYPWSLTSDLVLSRHRLIASARVPACPASRARTCELVRRGDVPHRTWQRAPEPDARPRPPTRWRTRPGAPPPRRVWPRPHFSVRGSRSSVTWSTISGSCRTGWAGWRGGCGFGSGALPSRGALGLLPCWLTLWRCHGDGEAGRPGWCLVSRRRLGLLRYGGGFGDACVLSAWEAGSVHDSKVHPARPSALRGLDPFSPTAKFRSGA